jgi:uncharacterized protein
LQPSREEKSIASQDIDPNIHFHFDDESHDIQDPFFNCRGIIINERFWNSICTELMELTKEAGPLVLYQLGLSYGFRVGVQSKGIAKDPAAVLKFLEGYGLLAGWGRFEAPALEKLGVSLTTSITVKLHNNFFARAAKSNSGNPSYFFVSGLLAGVLNGLLGSHCNCLEIECMATGSKYCEFIIAPPTAEH